MLRVFTALHPCLSIFPCAMLCPVCAALACTCTALHVWGWWLAGV
jgi:hypothetical protein